MKKKWRRDELIQLIKTIISRDKLEREVEEALTLKSPAFPSMHRILGAEVLLNNMQREACDERAKHQREMLKLKQNIEALTFERNGLKRTNGEQRDMILKLQPLPHIHTFVSSAPDEPYKCKCGESFINVPPCPCGCCKGHSS